jgi:hypothetical protein
MRSIRTECFELWLRSLRVTKYLKNEESDDIYYRKPFPPQRDRSTPMNWTALAAGAEIVAATGVIASLGYLSKQIKSSAQASREAAAQEVLNGNRIFLTQIGRDAATAGVGRRGMTMDATLTIDELAQFHALLLQLVYDWQRIFYLGKAGGLEPWALTGAAVTRREISSAPGFKRWYTVRKHWLTADFRDMLEAEMDSSNVYVPLGVVQ